MNKNIKITLITLGVLGTGVGLYYLLRPKKYYGNSDNSSSSSNDNIITKIIDKFSGRGFPLKRGSGGERVKDIQKFLNDSGSYGLVVDGKFGPATEAAVIDNQEPFEDFKSMYPQAIKGQVSKEFYNNAINTIINDSQLYGAFNGGQFMIGDY